MSFIANGGWLTKAYDYDPPRRGQIRPGTILKIEEHGATVDIGLKRDGFVPRSDIEQLQREASSSLKPGQEVMAHIVQPKDRDGNLVLSLYRAWLEKDWVTARNLLESGKVWKGKVTGCNQGGVIVKFGHLQGFVPASHLAELGKRRMSLDQRMAELETYAGRELSLKVIEVDKSKRRLILSERLASRQIRDQNMEHLLKELSVGQVRRGRVSRLCDFGAFVDLGGADGLVHISELAWQRVKHPGEVLQADQEIDVYVLRLDHQRKRIHLSLKRLQPSPWELVDDTYVADQLVSGKVVNVADFGAFVMLDLGVEGLVHISELSDPPPSDIRQFVAQGDELVLRILRIDSFRRRIGLSLKQVSEQERAEWLVQQAHDKIEVEPQQVSMPISIERSSDEGFWISLAKDEEAKQV